MACGLRLRTLMYLRRIPCIIRGGGRASFATASSGGVEGRGASTVGIGGGKGRHRRRFSDWYLAMALRGYSCKREPTNRKI